MEEGKKKLFCLCFSQKFTSGLVLVFSTAVTFLFLISPVYAGNPHSRLKGEQLPEIGGFSSLSEGDEYIIGRHWLYQSRSRLPILIRLPHIKEYIDQLVYEMIAYSDLSNPSFETILVRNKEINAFAVPGGVLGIHLGLLVAVESEDELASIIAHELGHISQRHYAELVSQQKSNSNLTLGTMLAGLGLIISGLPAYGVAAVASGAAFNAETTLDSMRLNETESDNISFEIMKRSGRDPAAVVRMFERLYKVSGDGQTPLIFRTHPLTQKRISNARSKTQGLSSKSYTAVKEKNQLDFYIARSIARIELSEDINNLAKVLSAEVDSTNQEDKRSGLLFGLASMYQKLGKLDESEKILQELRKKYPLNIFICTMLASTEVLLGKDEKAEQRLQQMLQITPGNSTLSSTLAVFYMKKEEYAKALELLDSMTATRAGDVWLWIQLEEVYGKLGFIDRVHYARGEHHFLIGRYASAKKQFTNAGKKTKDRLLKFRAKRRLEEVEDLERRVASLL